MPALPRRAALPLVVVAFLGAPEATQASSPAVDPSAAGRTTEPIAPPIVDRAAELDAPAAVASPRSEIDPDEPAGPGTADPTALATAEQRLQAADPGDLRAVADAAVTPIDGLWDEQQGAYVVAGVARARLNAEMLLVHAYAALAGERNGAAARPERVEQLVRLLTGPMYVPTLDGKVPPAPEPGHSITIHAPGFADPVGGLTSMHPALDAVAARALAAAWRARDVVGLSQASRDLIRDRVTAVARSPFWRSPARLLNQINWSADLYAAGVEVTGDPTLLRRDYRAQLVWFADHAREVAYPGGSPNLGSGGAFHYLPQRVASNATNRSDTVEYANITMGALAYIDRARELGMGQLPARTRRIYRGWVRRITWGDWSASGYLNWDSGKGLSRLHLTQYWLLALRGYAAGSTGSVGQAYLPDQVSTTRWLVRRAVATYQERARAADSVVLPATAFGFDGGPLVTPTFDGLTGTARFASTLLELADRGLASPAAAEEPVETTPLPDAYSNDEDIGRTAITTSRFTTAFLRPWAPLKVGGLEPSRLVDSRGRALTSMGGSGPGTLGLTLRSGGRTVVETQPGSYRRTAISARPAKSRLDRSAPLDGAMVVQGEDRTKDLNVAVRHRVSASNVKTTYTIRNARKKPVVAELRVPTYGTGAAGTLTVGQRIGPAALQRLMTVRTPTGARFQLRFSGLPPRARGTVVAVPSQVGNPVPGPQLSVRVTLPPKRTTTIERLILIPYAG